MPWYKSILSSFEAIPPNSPESRYLGSWNKLLNILFPPASPFTVYPKYSFPHNNPVADFISWFEIKFYTRPVFIVEISSPSALNAMPARGDADLFMRDRFRDYAGKFINFCTRYIYLYTRKAEMCPVPTLHGISVMGTRMAFYSLDVRNLDEADILPLPQVPQKTGTKDDFPPREQWSLDVLSEEGEAELRRIVEEIKAGCASLE